MKRREFVGCGAIAGAAGLAGTRATASDEPQPKAFDVPAFELDEASVAELQRKLTAGETSARRLAEAYLARIAALDRQGPELRSVIETNPEALAIADALDARAPGQGTARPAARHPRADQGQHRHRRSDDDDGRVAGAGGLDAVAGRARSPDGCARPAR